MIKSGLSNNLCIIKSAVLYNKTDSWEWFLIIKVLGIRGWGWGGLRFCLPHIDCQWNCYYNYDLVTNQISEAQRMK